MSTELAKKTDKSNIERLLRLVGSLLDPRAWAHAVKVVNYYNYTHVQELRKTARTGNVRISPTASFANGHNITLNDGVRIGAGCCLWAGPKDGKIVVGPDALFGPNVMLTASTYRYNDGSPVTEQAMKEADIILGRDVWIGYGAVILPGSTIGDGAIIGANAVVRGTVPSNAIMVGNPAIQVSERKIRV